MFINDLPDYLHFATDPDFLNSNPIKYLMIIILLLKQAGSLKLYLPCGCGTGCVEEYKYQSVAFTPLAPFPLLAQKPLYQKSIKIFFQT